MRTWYVQSCPYLFITDPIKNDLILLLLNDFLKDTILQNQHFDFLIFAFCQLLSHVLDNLIVFHLPILHIQLMFILKCIMCKLESYVFTCYLSERIPYLIKLLLKDALLLPWHI